MPQKSKMSISVAMCTYNGAEYLHQQLQSIASQTRLPDEMVVCDDGSCDDTVALLHRFAKEAGFPVRVHANSERLGTAKNFEQAIRLCQGDIITLSDQDDIWHQEKLQAIETGFLKRPEIGLLFHNAEIIDNTLHAAGYKLWQSTYFDRRLQRQVRTDRAFEALLAHNFATGATVAFRSKFRNLIIPIPETWMHDGWIAILIAAFAPILCIDRCLIGYRQHATQQLGARRRTIREHIASTQAVGNAEAYKGMPAQYNLVLERMLSRSDPAPGERTLSLLNAKIAHMTSRSQLPKSRPLRLPLIAEEWLFGRYRKFGYGWRGAVRDLIVNL